MGLSLARRLVVDEASQVAGVRRAATARAETLGFSEVGRGQVAIVATELATNLVRHGGRGHILISDHAAGLALVASDRGPGIRSLSQALQDGFSTAGGPGQGLGAIRRLAAAFDIQSSPAGTVVLAVMSDDEVASRDVDGLVIAVEPEEVSGDGWASARSGDLLTLALVDGLGHGPEAARATTTALREVLVDREPEVVLERMHAALGSTRGAAAAVARIDLRTGDLRFAGVGNIAAVLAGAERQRSLSSENGTVGHRVSRIQGYDHRLEPGDLLILHSDGCRTGWELAAQAGLRLRDPLVVAAAVLRDNERGRDDASVVVARRAAA